MSMTDKEKDPVQEQFQKAPTEPVEEPEVVFKAITDRDHYIITSEDKKTKLADINGYDVHYSFNMEYLNSLADVEACVQGLASLFRDVIMEKLLENKKPQ